MYFVTNDIWLVDEQELEDIVQLHGYLFHFFFNLYDTLGANCIKCWVMENLLLFLFLYYNYGLALVTIEHSLLNGFSIICRAFDTFFSLRVLKLSYNLETEVCRGRVTQQADYGLLSAPLIEHVSSTITCP